MLRTVPSFLPISTAASPSPWARKKTSLYRNGIQGGTHHPYLDWSFDHGIGRGLFPFKLWVMMVLIEIYISLWYLVFVTNLIMGNCSFIRFHVYLNFLLNFLTRKIPKTLSRFVVVTGSELDFYFPFKSILIFYMTWFEITIIWSMG